MGSIYQRGNVWWVKYHRQGRPFYESSGSIVHGDAKRLLQLREGDIARGVPVTPQVNRCTLDELLADVVTDYEVNGKKSVENLRRRITLHLLPYFGGRRAADIKTADVQRYVAQRQAPVAATKKGAAKKGAKNASINRELAALKRAYTLGIEGGKVLARPKIAQLAENNVREGFFEREQFEAVRAKLPEDIRPVITFAYITGWRINSEVLTLQWRQVDWNAGRVRLEPGTTKNKQAREFPLTDELRALLDAQRAHTDAVQKTRGAIIPHVFHRQGEPICSFYDSWRTACLNVGLGQRDPKTKRIKAARIPHDFRRSAVRNLVRAGIPERVAMTMTGHKTRAVFERYNVTSPGDLDDAATRLNAAAVTATVTETVTLSPLSPPRRRADGRASS